MTQPVDRPTCTIVAVDIGNTSTTIGCYRSDGEALPQRIGAPQRWRPTWSADDVLTLESRPADQRRRCWAIASVNTKRQDEFNRWLTEHFPHETFQILRRDQLGLQTAVRYPEFVGIDRLLAAVGARALPPFHVPKILVDLGTAITIDLLDGEGVFQGGAILAGQRATTIALSSIAERLPTIDDFEFEKPPEAVGKSTEEALAAGLYWGTVGAIRETIQQISRTLAAPPSIFLTGGDAQRLPIVGEYVPDLVLSGIASVGAQLFEPSR